MKHIINAKADLEILGIAKNSAPKTTINKQATSPFIVFFKFSPPLQQFHLKY